MDPNGFRHMFNTILPPSVEDNPICGATLARDWTGTGKPDCPRCEAERQRLIARAEARQRAAEALAAGRTR